MHLIFERGDHDAPVGHALIYFTADDGAVLATYVSVPPIQFDLTQYVPEFLKGAMQGMDLGFGDGVVATPIPPIPEEVPSVEYLQTLAAHRHDDLVYAGGVLRADPMRMAADTAEAARSYGELYTAPPVPETAVSAAEGPVDASAPFPGMSEGEILNELTVLIGRLRDALREGRPDPEVEQRMRRLAQMLPSKYRATELVDAAMEPGERGQQLAGLRLERCYKLFNEDYLDLPRIDREIEAIGG